VIATIDLRAGDAVAALAAKVRAGDPFSIRGKNFELRADPTMRDRQRIERAVDQRLGVADDLRRFDRLTGERLGIGARPIRLANASARAASVLAMAAP